MEILGMAFLTAMAFIILLVKMGLPKFIRFGWQTDVIISVVLTVLFFGTFAGILTGVIAGIFVSLFLSVMRFMSPPKK